MRGGELGEGGGAVAQPGLHRRVQFGEGLGVPGGDEHRIVAEAKASPGVQVFERATAVALAAESNDYAAAACKRHPTRFAALAAIAPQDPAAAAKELERATRTLGMKGGLINSHTFDHYLDEKQFWPIFEAAEHLDVPVYIHPREPASGMREIMSGPVVGGPAWAYGVEVGTHVLKLISGGVFDRFPKLRIVVGHMGESLPFWLPRIDNRYVAMRGGMFAAAKQMERMPSDYHPRKSCGSRPAA